MGHEDWVTCIASWPCGGALVLVTGGQDSLLRLWRLARAGARPADTLALTEQVVEVGGERCTVVAESVLAGHEGAVYSVAAGAGGAVASASMDRTVVVWREEGGAWVDSVTLGGKGGNTLGFMGACWGAGARSLLAHSWAGALHLWAEEGGVWGSGVVVGGHQGAVADLAWERQGRYLTSVSKDQTARVHAPWGGGGWQEVARPQVCTCTSTPAPQHLHLHTCTSTPAPASAPGPSGIDFEIRDWDRDQDY